MSFIRRFPGIINSNMGLVWLLTTASPSVIAATIGSLARWEQQDEAKIRSIREKEIISLRQTLGYRLGNSRKADLYFRLAELYLEAYREASLLEGRWHEEALKTDPSARLSRVISGEFVALGIRACEEILRFQIPFDKLDRVYYFLAFYEAQRGDLAKSASYHKKLVDRFPNSVFAADALRAQGEAAFQAKKYPEAIRALEQAIVRAGSDQLPSLHYKLAWSYYRNREPARAIASMKRSIAAARGSGERLVSVRDEALRDLTLFYAESGSVDEALSTYASLSEGQDGGTAANLENLGRSFEKKGEVAAARKVYEQALSQSRDAELQERLRYRLTNLALKKRDQPWIHKALQGVNAQISETPESENEILAHNLRVELRRLALLFHSEGRKSRELGRKKESANQFEQAEFYYRELLTHFYAAPSSVHSELNLYLAEVLEELGRKKDSLALLQSVAENDRDVRGKEANLKILEQSAAVIRAEHKASSSTRPKSLSNAQQAFVEAVERLKRTQPDSKETLQSEVKLAQLLAGVELERERAASICLRLMTDDKASAAQKETCALLALEVSFEGLSTEKLRSQTVAKRAVWEQVSQSAGSSVKVRNLLGDIDLLLTKAEAQEAAQLGNPSLAAEKWRELSRKVKSPDEKELAYLEAVKTAMGTGSSLDAEIRRFRSLFPRSKRWQPLLESELVNAWKELRFTDAAQTAQALGRTELSLLFLVAADTSSACSGLEDKVPQKTNESWLMIARACGDPSLERRVLERWKEAPGAFFDSYLFELLLDIEDPTQRREEFRRARAKAKFPFSFFAGRYGSWGAELPELEPVNPARVDVWAKQALTRVKEISAGLKDAGTHEEAWILARLPGLQAIRQTIEAIEASGDTSLQTALVPSLRKEEDSGHQLLLRSIRDGRKVPQAWFLFAQSKGIAASAIQAEDVPFPSWTFAWKGKDGVPWKGLAAKSLEAQAPWLARVALSEVRREDSKSSDTWMAMAAIESRASWFRSDEGKARSVLYWLSQAQKSDPMNKIYSGTLRRMLERLGTVPVSRGGR